MEEKFPTRGSAPEHMPQTAGEQKKEALGRSKIEQGLATFKVYRIARGDDLLTPKPLPINAGETSALKKMLNRGIFFTTQKEMALEYRMEKKPVMLEERGIDFLSDLAKIANQGISVILLSHEDAGTYERMRKGRVKDNQEIENFIVRHTFDPRNVSPRMLRRAAEIIVLMPEEINRLPLSHITLKGVRPISEKPKHREYHKPIRGGGGFHERLTHSNRKSDQILKSLHRREKKLLSEKNKIIYEFALHPDNIHLESKLFQINGNLKATADAIRKRQQNIK